MVIAPPLAGFALRFGPPEYTALLVLGLVFLAYMSTTSLARTLADGGVRPAARHHRHRRDDRALPFLVRYPRARRRHRHRAGRGRAVRPRRNPLDDEPAGDQRSASARSCASCGRTARSGASPRCRSRAAACSDSSSASSRARRTSFPASSPMRSRRKSRSTRRSSARARSKESPDRNRRTTPPRPAHSCRCSRSAFRRARSPRC